MFSYDSGFSALIRKLWSLVALSCMWLLCCLPVFTVGAATVSLIHTVRKYLIEEEGYVAREFFACFRREFLGATKLWLIFLAAGLFLGWECWYCIGLLLCGDPMGVLAAALVLMLLALAVWCVHCLLYTASFEDSTRTVLKNAGRIALVHPLINLIILMFSLLFLISLVFLPGFLLILPAAAVWITCRGMGKIYGKLIQVSEMEETL